MERHVLEGKRSPFGLQTGIIQNSRFLAPARSRFDFFIIPLHYNTQIDSTPILVAWRLHFIEFPRLLSEASALATKKEKKLFETKYSNLNHF